MLREGVERLDEAEFFIWLRGYYRSMGIGRVAADQILCFIDAQRTLPQKEGPPIRRLVTYYPLRDTSAGGRLELEAVDKLLFRPRLPPPETTGAGCGGSIRHFGSANWLIRIAADEPHQLPRRRAILIFRKKRRDSTIPDRVF